MEKIDSDDDYYSVSECLSSKVSSYGSCTPVASDNDNEEDVEFDVDKVVEEMMEARRLQMLSPVFACDRTNENKKKVIPKVQMDNPNDSRDVLELKVLELCPELTLLGETLEEALNLQTEHERVLEKIQGKQSPVSELLKKTDHLIATQNVQPEVYAAMADSLGIAWKDVNDILQNRGFLLHLNVEYHRQAELCMQRIRALEMLCHSYLPTNVEAIKNHLDQINEVRKSVLETLMVTLGNGTQLLDFLKEIYTKGTLDSRPGYNQHSTSLAISQVEHWLEKLHDNRQSIDIDCHERKTMLEKRLTISLLVIDLNLLENIILERYSSLEKVKNSLGDSEYECLKLTEVNENLIIEAKDIRDQALRVVKATEQLVLTKGYMEEDYKFKAYKLLETATEYLEELSNRERLLDSAIHFFKCAEKVLGAWDTILQDSSDENQSSKANYVTETVKRTGASVIQDGNLLLREVPLAKGVKKVVDELERKKQLILSILMKDHDKYIESSEAVTTFSENYNAIFSWLVSSAETFLNEHNSMTTNLKESREFLNTHKKILNDLRTKGIDINALVSSTSLPPLTFIDVETRVELENKSSTLKDHWTYLDRILSWRINLAELFVKFFSIAENLDVEFSNLDEMIGKYDITDQNLDTGNKQWTNIMQLYAQLNNTGDKCLHQCSQTEDVHLKIDVAQERIKSVLDLFADRKTKTTSVWESWQRTLAENKLDKVLWKENMCESSKTVDWVSKLETQLYPILKTEPLTVDRHILEVENKLNNILPEVQRAQDEIETRVRTAEELIGKGNVQGENISIPPRLKELHSRLISITTEYQNLLEMFLSFFNSLQKFHNTVCDAEKSRQTEIINLKLDEVEELYKSHNKSRQTVLDNFKTVYAENIRLMDKIKQQEPQKSAEQDMYVVRCLMENERNVWDQSCEIYCQKIEQQQQLSQFDNDLIQINNNLNDLSQQLASTKGQYGSNLASAKSASLAFHYFEKTILLLEQRIETFISAANSLMSFDHTKSEHIKKELSQLKSKWDTFQSQVAESRIHIDVCVQYFSLIEEAQQWIYEGSRVLMNIVQKSTDVKSQDEALILLNEIELFLKPNDRKQEERINKIYKLGEELYGKQDVTDVSKVVTENQELLDSFSLIFKELKSFDEKFKSGDNLDDHKREVNQIIANAHEEIMTSNMNSKSIKNTIPEKKKLHENIKLNPNIIKPLQDCTVNEGKKISLECSIESKPSKVTWFKDGIAIENNPDYQTTIIDNLCILTIEETFVEDSASYTCRVDNDSGYSETSAYLTVKECQPESQMCPSVFTKLLSDLIVDEEEPCLLSCKAEGNPLPTVQWYKDDMCIENNPKYQITYNNGEALLKIERVHLYHKGKYICVATNKLGSDSTSSKLLVNEKSQETPKFIMPLSNVMARAGQKLKLECEVETNDSPTLIWLLNGKMMKEIKDFKNPENRGKINLIIPEAYPKDAGTYTLIIKTKYGEVSSSCQVSVKGILPNETSDSEITCDIDPVKPSILSPLSEQTVTEGQSVYLKCVIIGQPEPEVIWYHDGKPVKESKDIQLLFQGDQCSLVIKEAFVDDAGEYKVIAINSAGEASSIGFLKIQPRPNLDLDKLVEAPKFIKLLSDVLVREGDPITLECNANGCPKPEFKWIRNTVEIKPDHRIILSSNEDGTAILHIPKALPIDKGQYTVRATNTAGEAKCFSHVIVKSTSSFDIANIGVSNEIKYEEKLEKPVFIETFTDAIVFLGDFVKFECIVVGKPTPKVRWYFNSKPVSGKSFLVSISGDRQVLTIPATEFEHNGLIECIAENEAGKCSCISQLKIKEQETLSLIMENNKNNEQKSTIAETFERCSNCDIKNSMLMSSSSTSFGDSNFKEASFDSQMKKQSLQLGDNTPVQCELFQTKEYYNIDGQKSHHGTDYNSTNAFDGYQSSFFEICSTQQDTKKDNKLISSTEKNIIKQNRKPTAPRFISPPQGKIAEQGDDVFLEVIIDSYPLSVITWSKNGVDIFPDGKKFIVTNQVNKNRLDIKCLCVEDGGHYTCKAINDAGSTSCTTDIIVRKNVFPPVMCRRLIPNTIGEGDRVVLEVEVTGTPEPTINWYFNNQSLVFPSENFRLRQQGNCSAVIIEKATSIHAGEYKVIAKNEGGEAVSCADLRIVQPIPDVDMNLSLSSECDKADRVNFDYYKSIVPSNNSYKFRKISKIEEKSLISKSIFHKETINNTENSSVEHSNLTGGLENTTINNEVNKKQITSQNENVEDISISKKSALQFFKNVIEETKEKQGTFIENARNLSPNTTKNLHSARSTKSSVVLTPKAFNEEEKLLSSTYNKLNGTEVILEPGTPPTFDYMPRTQVVKNDQMTERLKKLSINQKSLSPDQIPSGAVRIFPNVATEKKQEIFEETCIKKKVIKSNISENISSIKYSNMPELQTEHNSPLLRPQADINVRPGSPRPSAEAITMEKLWSKSKSQNTPTSCISPKLKTYSSSETQSYFTATEAVENNGKVVINEGREEKLGSINIESNGKNVHEKFENITIGSTKNVESPRSSSAKLFYEKISPNTIMKNKCSTPDFTQNTLQSELALNCQHEFSKNSKLSQFTNKINHIDNNVDKYNLKNTTPIFLQQKKNQIKHVEAPKFNSKSSTLPRVHSEDSKKNLKPQSPTLFNDHFKNKTYSSVESHSNFLKQIDHDGLVLESEHKEVGGQVNNDGVQKTFESFSHNFKTPTKNIEFQRNQNKANSIKTMHKFFEQSGSSSSATYSRPFSRMKVRNSDSEFESETELSKYIVDQYSDVPSSKFQRKSYSASSQVQETKATPSVVLQSPVKDSGYVADTDEPRSIQSDVTTNSLQNSLRKNVGFQSSFLKKAEFFENERHYNPQPPQWVNKNNQLKTHIRSPANFIEGNFHKSDCESDHESNRRSQSIWRPCDSESKESMYKLVKPSFQQPFKSVETPNYQVRNTRIQLKDITEPEFQLKPGTPPEIGFAPYSNSQKIVCFNDYTENGNVQNNLKSENGHNSINYQDTLEKKAEAIRLQRVNEMRRRFEQKSFVPTNETNSFQTISSQSVNSSDAFIGTNQIYCFKIDLPCYKYDFGYKFGIAYPKQIGNNNTLNRSSVYFSVPVVHKSSNHMQKRSNEMIKYYNSYTSVEYINKIADGAVISPIHQKELNTAIPLDPSHSIPIFMTPLKDIAVVSGKTARFECIVQGEPIENIVWMCNGQVLSNSDCYQMEYRNGVCKLLIPKAYQFNAGLYVCTVSNYLGASSTLANLQVSGESRTYIQR
ncbi:muscle M-line assembly protein unc-89 isoform X2 [Daktulosphaira vitifoliae]|uniref:muscle M-line assembly protein unc-89 isoform X2 n=1 Tax=Daktulosphaira vitifoliae TaxID=58002 RepID=UPI0021AAE960|nr:muscle M-line assembly protein unc-89 isoform X2 [Daktulosphaira vitifoliae]